MTTSLVVVERREEAEAELAREVAALVRERRRVVLGLATGDTPSGLYRELARQRREEGLDFAEVVTFNLDEYLDLPSGHPASFSRWMLERVFEPLGIAGANRHVPAADCAAYERSIREAGGIDLQILGIGRNGHIAFNEPPSFRDSRTREVRLHAWTREDAVPMFGGLAEVPTRAVTMGIGTILDAKRIRVLAFGPRKAEIVRRALEGPIDPEVPASFLRDHADLRIWLDREAARELRSSRRAVRS
ncbi:MAG: glucosamine-6-phosphate deaminase [Planctomycetota bacterium]